jgi:hypothetical protein
MTFWGLFQVVICTAINNDYPRTKVSACMDKKSAPLNYLTPFPDYYGNSLQVSVKVVTFRHYIREGRMSAELLHVDCLLQKIGQTWA